MNDAATLVTSSTATLVPTPNEDTLPRRLSTFATFGEALDYAASGKRGLNFHDPRGSLARVYPYSELRSDALTAARRLVAHGVGKGDRVALVAETGPDFAALFCGCIYAGAWPVPLPLPTSFGGKESYIDQLAVQLQSSDPLILFYPAEIAAMAGAAAKRQGCQGIAWQDFRLQPAPECTLPPVSTDDICYLQYSSGSTRFPHGVAVTHASLLNNLAGHGEGMKLIESDRCVSWLPWYHDMGLVGCFLSLIANQVSADYLKTEDFARRPLAWLDLISRNPGTTASYSPTFGYDICARRISSQSHVSERFDLSRWRIAGNGADMIRPDVMQGFVNAFAEAGFKASAFLPSYGLAEATLAVTIMPPGEGIRVELVEEERLSGTPRDLSRPARYRAIVNCGKAVKDMALEIRGEHGNALPDHHIGKVWCKGPSVMHSYFRDPESTDACLVDGWLDTGDMGYLVDGYLFIVGRAKDMIIINGKNHWPQDIEWAVEQLPGFHQGDIAAFSVETEGGEEVPAVLVHCRVSDPEERIRLHDQIRDKVRSITGMNCVVELVPPRTLPRTSSGKLSRAKAKKLYLSGEIEPFKLAA
ncbi:MAG: fatty acyl-AMP ligase [Novosphingobium sp.]|uniref:fatty acyl-AMP ligase n=1 Tax=Novosphingobium sp. TaxID=1874826 RepID=UPI0032B861B0